MSADAVVAVVDALRGAGVDASVAGGWAVDALLGWVTREHDDLDLAVDTDDVDRAVEVLAGLGLGVIADERPGRLVLGDGARSVDLHPVVWDASGTGHQTSRSDEVYEYPPGSIDAVGRIGDREVRCLTPELLVTFHLGYEPRPVDRADMAALAERFELVLPAPYDAGGVSRTVRRLGAEG